MEEKRGDKVLIVGGPLHPPMHVLMNDIAARNQVYEGPITGSEMLPKVAKGKIVMASMYGKLQDDNGKDKPVLMNRKRRRTMEKKMRKKSKR